MEKYLLSDDELAHYEQSCIPLAIYRSAGNRVVTRAVSEGFCRLFRVTRDEARQMLDKDMYGSIHPDDVARVIDAAHRFTDENGAYNVVFRSRIGTAYRIIHSFGEHAVTPDGEQQGIIWYADEGVYNPDTNDIHSAISRSLSSSLHEETLYQHVHFDRLTGLPSMSRFFELAERGIAQMRAEGTEPAVLFFNLNGMKYFNKSYGFAAGDRLINAVAGVLTRFFGNDHCSRFGQDHFAVYTEAEGIEERVKELFIECWKINNGKSLPVHVGIYPDSIEQVDVSTACDRAKYACDLIRETYVSSYRFFDKEVLAQAVMQRYIVEHVDQAIQEGWIQVYYQAIVRASNGRVCDEEALARWIDPQLGFLSPADFIPILEGAELIYKLDLHVISLVLQKMRTQAEAGLYVVPQSVNLSRTDFNEPGFVDEICRMVDAAGIERSKLTLEITESVIGRDFVFMKSQVERLQGLGFMVWMDDFGSGYSSLDVLQSIRFDLIKLDMRFMEHFNEREESKIILTELVRMCIGLGIETLAEGVETKEQVDFLREIGCSKIQGYFFTKPIPLDTLMDRQQAGTLIGFENPEEAEYYTAIGHISLYDSSAIVQDDYRGFQQYFDTIPMVIIEANDEGLWVMRCNKSYREYLERSFNYTLQDNNVPLPELEGRPRTSFTEALYQCAADGSPVIIDNELRKGEITHAIINRIAINPVTGTAALLVAVLAIVTMADLHDINRKGIIRPS